AAGTRLTVAVPARLEGLDARRPVLSRAVDWQVLPGAMPLHEPPEREPPRLVVRHGGGDAPALRYLRAAALAWQEPDSAPGDAFSAAPAAEPVDPGASHLVWLAPGPLPDAVLERVEAGGVVLLGDSGEVEFPRTPAAWWRDGSGEAIVEGVRMGGGRLLRFTRPLVPASLPVLLEPDFPRHLRTLFEAPGPAPASALAVRHAPGTGASAYA